MSLTVHLLHAWHLLGAHSTVSLAHVVTTWLLATTWPVIYPPAP